MHARIFLMKHHQEEKFTDFSNCRNFWTNDAICMSFEIQNVLGLCNLLFLSLEASIKPSGHNFMTAADSAVVLLELSVQWDLAGTH